MRLADKLHGKRVQKFRDAHLPIEVNGVRRQGWYELTKAQQERGGIDNTKLAAVAPLSLYRHAPEHRIACCPRNCDVAVAGKRVSAHLGAADIGSAPGCERELGRHRQLKQSRYLGGDNEFARRPMIEATNRPPRRNTSMPMARGAYSPPEPLHTSSDKDAERNAAKSRAALPT